MLVMTKLMILDSDLLLFNFIHLLPEMGGQCFL